MSLKVIENIAKNLDDKTFNPFTQIGSTDSEIVNEQFELIRSNCRYFNSPLIHKPQYIKNNLNILHVNVRSILSDAKFDEFQLFVDCSNDHWQVICVSESWLSDEIIPLRQLV